MTDTQHKPEAGTPITRCYTVSYVSDAQYHRVAALTLKGRWLGAMGFETGQRIEVLPGPGQLIVRLVTEG